MPPKPPPANQAKKESISTMPPKPPAPPANQARKESRSESVVTIDEIPLVGRPRSRFMSMSSSDTNWEEYVEQLNKKRRRKPSGTLHVAEAQKFSTELIKAFLPLEIFMKIMFRFPLIHEPLPLEGAYMFKFKGFSVQTIGFLITGVLLLISLFLMILNMFGYLMDYPSAGAYGEDSSEQIRAYELYIFRRNIIPALMIFTNLIHLSIASVNFIFKREFAAKCMTFWTQAAGLLRMELGKGVRKYMIFVLVTYLSIWFFLIVFTISQIIPVGTGAPGIFAHLMGRMFVPHLFLVPEFTIFRGVFAFWMIYIGISSKIYVILYIFHCKILQNAFDVWNERVDRVLNWGESGQPKRQKNENRTGFHHLFTDHVCLLDMIEGADALFGYTVESYYLFQILSLCFEIYYFFRSQLTKTEFSGARSLDGVYMLFYLAQSIFILFVVSKSAANVGETAMEGLEILRKSGLLGRRRTSEDHYFVFSMYMSFDGHFDTALTAGKYFVIDNSTLIAILGTVFLYFVTIVQFSPQLTYFPLLQNEADYLSNEVIRRVLENFEGSWDIFPRNINSSDMNSTTAFPHTTMNSTTSI